MNEVIYRLMRPLLFIVCLFLAVAAYSGDTLSDNNLRGYKKLFYKLVLLHPKINSTFERSLLKHYLAGSGAAYLIAGSDFVKLKNTVTAFEKSDCVLLKSNPQYCTVKVKLDEDVYFGWGLGTITCIFSNSSNEMISFADVYDFNKKKKGQRSFKSEIVTRIFRLIAPRSAKAFIVSYGTAAFYSQIN
ncbi:MAG: hypothetical protein K2X48_20045 [Chitinophagaceae bacterium]|nr:hypothetical protein [Chitinophagaceae bacterium]